MLVLLVAGCGTSTVLGGSGGATNGPFSIAPGTATISTNSPVQFTASTSNGTPLNVQWAVAGGDTSGPGTITKQGLYFPPSAISHSVVIVVVQAQQTNPDGSTLVATARLTVTPGFLIPIAPQNFSVTPGNTVPLTAVLGQINGGSVTWALSTTSGGSTAAPSGFGSISAGQCKTGSNSFTTCAATYTAPSSVPGGGVVFATATVANTSNRQSAHVLINPAINSSPVTHQALESTTVQLGTSGGNAFDVDTDNFGNVLDCCGGTLGALLAGSDGKQYVLSTNHVLAASDQASRNDAIIQPGLPDTNCSPTQADQVGTLTYAVPLNSNTSNSDAAVASVNVNGANTLQVDPSGNILELGALGANGQLAAAAPAAGAGEAVSSSNIPTRVAKSGRSTGLTCSTISAIATTVQLQYYFDCAETQPYISKTFQNQILISGASFAEGSGSEIFSDITGDSGSLVVDQSNAQPVGLLYATNDTTAVANPVADVLRDLSQTASSQGGTAVSFSFVGGAQHPVACLNYDAGTASTTAGPAVTLSAAEGARAHTAAAASTEIVKASTGVLGVGEGASFDAPGSAAVLVYLDRTRDAVAVPAMLHGVRTQIIPVDAAGFSLETAPKKNSPANGLQLPAATLNQAIAIKQAHEQQWLRDASVFAVGVGQSFDNPAEAALVVLVEKGKNPSWMPSTVSGLRVRYQHADRFHTSREQGFPLLTRCSAHQLATGIHAPLSTAAEGSTAH